jgi:hypothetical protein
LLTVVQFDVACVPAVQTVTLISGELTRLNCVAATVTGTVLAAVLEVGFAVGLAESSVLVAAGVLLAGVLLESPVGEADEELPPPPPPQAAKTAKSAATNAQVMVRFMFVLIIAGRRGWCPAEASPADTPGR